LIIATLVALLAVGLAAPAASAGGSLLGLNNNCGSTSTPFAQFGDYRYYTFGTNGGFENGSSGWSLSGGTVVPGNETYFAHSSSDRYSLSLPAGSSALTPRLCMGTTSTVMRFFVKSNNGGSVRVEVVLRNVLGQVLASWSARRLIRAAQVHDPEWKRPGRRRVRRSLGFTQLGHSGTFDQSCDWEWRPRSSRAGSFPATSRLPTVRSHGSG
jgi:hypothetical protein